MATNVDLGGNDLHINNLYTGASTPNSAGTLFVGAADTVSLDGVQTISAVKTFSANPTFATGNTIKLNAGTATLVSNASTLTKYATQVTSEAITTAAAGSQAFVLTLAGVAATDLVFVTKAGGTNTRHNYQLEAVATTNTVTVTLYNTEPSNAINGTVIFNIWVLKA